MDEKKLTYWKLAERIAIKGFTTKRMRERENETLLKNPHEEWKIEQGNFNHAKNYN